MLVRIWTKGQAISVVLGIVLLTAMVSMGVAWACLARTETEAEGAVAVFAEDEQLFSVAAVNTPESSVEATAVPTAEPEETGADTSFRVEVIRTTPEPVEEAKRILIYHTHTWEAYAQVDDAPYAETEKWRTKDERCNVVAVGTALANQLRALGCSVVHDTTAFEPPSLETAYERSLSMLKERLQAGEDYDLFIDLHRDAISSSSTIKRTVNIGGAETARFMVLIGKGTGAGFDVKPDWEANLAIAEDITNSLNSQVDGLCRDIKVKTGRFNQHIAPRCVLIECGNNLNTLEQTLNGIPYLAQAIMDALTSTENATDSGL